ncbi:ribonuclease P 40kDa subunit [Stagonosporopsis vannaccii]|nr:ribonuclease P 40kDa subunit [Stagonosporopsis vannaccii]
MLDIHKPPPSSDTKTFFSHSVLPAYIDPLNPPCKKKPLSAFYAMPHSHTLDLVLPAEVWQLVHTHLAHLNARVYARAWLKLSDILDDEFLDAYIRNASATLLSAGRPLLDTRLEIVAGVLRIDMSRPLYERAGLVGVPVEDGGAKHKRNRWVVTYDLTAPSMRSGKKGFERLKWAARNVLDESRAWLFWTQNASFAESLRDGREVLCAHAPKIFALDPAVEPLQRVVVPKLDVQGHGLSALYDHDDALALLEWLDMLSLGSSRVRDGHAVDSHLCRYDVPDFGHGADTRELVRVRWRGFITPPLVKDLFLEVWKAGFKSKRVPKRTKGSDQDGDGDADGHISMDGTQDGDAEKWFSMSAQAFGGTKTWSLMQFASRETLVWEVEA